MHIDDWLLKVLVGLLSGLLVQLAVFLAKNVYKLTKKAIKVAQQQQSMQQSDLLNTYVDLEELLGDFLEKYRELSRETPPPTRREFFYEMALDAVGLLKGFVEIALRRLFGSDETPRA